MVPALLGWSLNGGGLFIEVKINGTSTIRVVS